MLPVCHKDWLCSNKPNQNMTALAMPPAAEGIRQQKVSETCDRRNHLACGRLELFGQKLRTNCSSFADAHIVRAPHDFRVAQVQ